MKLVRHTEGQLLEVGSTIAQLAQEAQQTLSKAPHLSASTQERLANDLRIAIEVHQQISKQSRRLTQGKRLNHYKILDCCVLPFLASA